MQHPILTVGRVFEFGLADRHFDRIQRADHLQRLLGYLRRNRASFKELTSTVGLMLMQRVFCLVVAVRSG